MADLPRDRLVPDEPPFTRCGVDYFGPIEIKRARSVVKRYGVVFTCFASRAIHLEVACPLDTDSCINAFQRFVARRGQVKVMRSDNGTNLVGAEREMRKEIQKWNQSKMYDFFCQQTVKWNFNPPAGSHFGGVWERQIRTIRMVLVGLLREKHCVLDDGTLQTLLCEVEAIINSRPITAVSNDPNDVKHLLLLREPQKFPPGVFVKEDVHARRRWRQVQYLADQFWKWWTREFLPPLQVRPKWSNVRRNLVQGDIVVLVDSSSPRSLWPLGRVVNVMKDSKSVKVKTKSAVLERPVDKLCLIVEAEDDTQN